MAIKPHSFNNVGPTPQIGAKSTMISTFTTNGSTLNKGGAHKSPPRPLTSSGPLSVKQAGSRLMPSVKMMDEKSFHNSPWAPAPTQSLPRGGLNKKPIKIPS